MSKVRELAEEFRTVFTGRGSIADSVLPPLVFLILNGLLGLEVAIGGSLVVALLIGALRLFRRQSLRYALGGLGGVVLAIVLAWWLGRAEAYFLPGILSGVFTALACVVSALASRPLVAWTSYLYRRWPLDWYWHPRVRPAYSEVTWLWAFFFAARLLLQVALFQREAVGLLGIINVAMGWPAMIVLLALSYLYGTWRLRRLEGPSVGELRAGAEPPWTGQRRGF